MRLSDSLVLAYEDFKVQHFENNNGIYDMFNDSQIEAVKKYFRWRTKRRFKELCENTTLETKPKKAEELSYIMGGATDWVYDGCVDTGYKGGGHCELGHALRYEHYAYSKSLNRCIVFGVNCAADFFGIEPKKLRQINSVQMDTLEDIKLIAFIRGTGRTLEFMKEYYGDLGDIINVFKGKLDDVFGVEWNEIMGDFLGAGLPLTVPMICKIDYVRKKYYLPTVEAKKRTERLKELMGNNIEDFNVISKSELHLLKTSARYLTEFMGDNSEYRKKCCKVVVKQATEFNTAYNKIKELGVKDIEKFVRSGNQSVLFVTTEKGDRVATVREREIIPEQSYVRNIKALPDNKLVMLSCIGWCCTGKSEYYTKMGFKGTTEDELSKIEESALVVRDTISWINSTDFRTDIRILADAVNKYKYLESADDEIKSGTSINEMMEFIMDNSDKSNPLWSIKVSRDIIEKYKKYKFKLSKKQEEVILSAYKAIQKTSNSDAIKKAKIIVQSQYEPIVSQKYSFHLKVAKSVVEKNYASEKQEKIINEAYDGIVNNKGLSEEIPEEQLFISKSGYNDYELKEYRAEIYDIPDVIAPKKSNESFSDIERYVPVGMPSLVEISQALGTGEFKYVPLYEE